MKKGIIISFIILAVLGLGLLLFIQEAKHPEIKDPWGNKSTRDLALSCLDQEYTNMHIHPELKIVINGQEQLPPANIGIQGVSGDVSHQEATQNASCLHPIHIHAADGLIHVESPVQRDYQLADFFAVWNKTFDQNQILDYKADGTHRVRMTVNDQENTEFENLVLKDKDKIVIYYETK